MRIEAIAFTGRGLALARSLADSLRLDGCTVTVSGPPHLAADAGVMPYKDVSSWAAHAFAKADALLFVGACGIAVRCIAPHVRDKLSDPAVVCVDEAGNFAIALLSGHVGGANSLAWRVAAACGGQPVVTTATDVNGVFAVDEWACSQQLALLDRDEAKRVSAELLAGDPVGFTSDVPIAGNPPNGLVCGDCAGDCAVGVAVSVDGSLRPFPHTLRLAPRIVTVGVGCKRGTAADAISALVDACLDEAHLLPQTVYTLATIDVKADEPSLRQLAKDRGWKLRFHSAEELASVPDERAGAAGFSSSDFVRKVVGVDNVCERAACACGETLVLSRRAREGVTVALARREIQLSFPSVGKEL